MATAAPEISSRDPASKRFIDLAGRKFGKLTVTKFAGFQKRLGRWHCSCECGGETIAWGNRLRQGATQHCGCQNKNDGRSRHPLFHTWCGMISRCHDANSRPYYLYGGRGIVVCDRWRNSFNDFLADVGEKPSPEHSLGRIDNDGNYDPGNVRWETIGEQARNKRSCRYVTCNGITKTISEWARDVGVTTEAMRLRLKKDAPVEWAVSAAKGEVIVVRDDEDANSLSDDSRIDWPDRFKLGVDHHVLLDPSRDAHRVVDVMRKMAAAWDLNFKSRILGQHILFRFDHTKKSERRFAAAVRKEAVV